MDVNMKISPPEELLEPLNIETRLLLTAGPSNIHEEIIEKTFKLPVSSIVDPQYFQVLKDVKNGIKYVFQTENDYTFAISGPSHFSMESAILNIVSGGETLLVARNGIWGQRAAIMGLKRQFNVIEMEKPEVGESVFSLNDFEVALRDHNPKLLYVCHGDSSTGILQSIKGLGRLCHKFGCLLLVDTVASLLASPIFMDEDEIDVMYSGSQKALNAPPGLTIISFSKAAILAIKNRKDPIPSFCLNALLMGESWACSGDKWPYHVTHAVTLLYSLREALALVVREGLEEVIKRHQNVSLYLQKELDNLNIKFLVKDPKNRLPSIVTILPPQGININFVKQYMIDHFSIEVSGGLGPTNGKIWRIGLFGVNATFENCDKLINALKQALSAAVKTSKL